jgi:hypothetical protein
LGLGRGEYGVHIVGHLAVLQGKGVGVVPQSRGWIAMTEPVSSPEEHSPEQIDHRDRHVVACALFAGADAIVTNNIPDFSAETLCSPGNPQVGFRQLTFFKAFFNRRRDWADIEEMHRAGWLDVPYVIGTLTESLGLRGRAHG